MNRKKQDQRFVFLALFPAVVLILIFMVYPTLNVFYISLFRWGGFSREKAFIGFQNFVTLMSDMRFLKSFQNTILLIVVVTIVTLALALIYASLLVREKVKGQNFYRIVFYIPNILSVTVISAIFSALYNPSQGIITSISRLFNAGESVQFLGDPKIVIYSIAIAMIWQAIGYYMVMYMAAMSSIPVHLYEQAELEGASKLYQFFNITIPLIWDNIRTTLTFFIVSTINLSFLITNIMTQGGPDGASQTFLGYLYNQAYYNSSYGYGMAIGAVVFVFSFALSALINRLTKREPVQY